MGLGLRVEARALQWNADTLARDIIFFVYDVINLSDCDYDTAAFGVLLTPGVGSYQSVRPNQNVTVSTTEDLLIATATSGQGYPDNWQTGYIGLMFLETPAKSATDTVSAGIASVANHWVADHGPSGFILQNDSTLWGIMSSGVVDTVYNNANLVTVVGTRTFAMKRWTSHRFGVAFVFAQTRDTLSLRAAYARRMAAAGYRTPSSFTGVNPLAAQGIPTQASLDQNYPNPFNPTTVVSFQLPVASNVWLAVYDLLGREVAVLVNERKAPGSYKVKFDGSSLASGVYFYRLQAGDFVQSRKLLSLR
jgi:hypothetical protein